MTMKWTACLGLIWLALTFTGWTQSKGSWTVRASYQTLSGTVKTVDWVFTPGHGDDSEWCEIEVHPKGAESYYCGSFEYRDCPRLIRNVRIWYSKGSGRTLFFEQSPATEFFFEPVLPVPIVLFPTPKAPDSPKDAVLSSHSKYGRYAMSCAQTADRLQSSAAPLFPYSLQDKATGKNVARWAGEGGTLGWCRLETVGYDCRVLEVAE